MPTRATQAFNTLWEHNFSKQKSSFCEVWVVMSHTGKDYGHGGISWRFVDHSNCSARLTNTENKIQPMVKSIRTLRPSHILRQLRTHLPFPCLLLRYSSLSLPSFFPSLPYILALAIHALTYFSPAPIFIFNVFSSFSIFLASLNYYYFWNRVSLSL